MARAATTCTNGTAGFVKRTLRWPSGCRVESRRLGPRFRALLLLLLRLRLWRRRRLLLLRTCFGSATIPFAPDSSLGAAVGSQLANLATAALAFARKASSAIAAVSLSPRRHRRLPPRRRSTFSGWRWSSCGATQATMHTKIKRHALLSLKISSPRAHGVINSYATCGGPSHVP